MAEPPYKEWARSCGIDPESMSDEKVRRAWEHGGQHLLWDYEQFDVPSKATENACGVDTVTLAVTVLPVRILVEEPPTRSGLAELSGSIVEMVAPIDQGPEIRGDFEQFVAHINAKGHARWFKVLLILGRCGLFLLAASRAKLTDLIPNRIHQDRR